MEQYRRAVGGLLAVLLLGGLATAAVADTGGASAAHNSEGIWKAYVPPGALHAEFAGNDPIGVAAGKRIQADCSLNWVDPDDGARYCFSSGTSLEFFLERPHEVIVRAREQWRRLAASQPPD